VKSFDSYKKWKYTKFLSNKNYSFNRNYILNIISSKIITDAFNSISKWKYYKKTPLLKLEKLNKNLKLNSISNIEVLKKLKNLRFTFGSENSTSGRLMPEYFLNQAGVEIKHFKGEKAGFSGSHDATIALVYSGAFDAGALNKQVWENTLKNNPKRTSNLELFWITPEYVDYHWVAQGDLENRFGGRVYKQT